MSHKDPKPAPWAKKKAKTGASIKLTPEQIEMARERAHKAGRRYPNLVDNMWVAKLVKTMEDLP